MHWYVYHIRDKAKGAAYMMMYIMRCIIHSGRDKRCMRSGMDQGARVRSGMDQGARVHSGMDQGARVHSGMDQGARVHRDEIYHATYHAIPPCSWRRIPLLMHMLIMIS